ncbi:MAG TPA: GNAT family N-acetyltransferase [Bradyrhizobium sp.]|uniref:GNAT family N-acetyltransferase n=1 Tax=Bradyrhizobium sp. TaxID=376 RepID=UPI002B8F17B3|nr:GNAT family N-acetyltransferase [Bradyrhizobium sp.]HLZ05735.1 GNAT family N-acetyltransferase [Bradyrhizobium sp.]
MADTEHLAISQLDPHDAAGGLKLSTEAHWNQNEADWQFFLTKGIVFGTRDRNGNLVATAALLPYTETDAWISMVLVTESWRRRGLATRLVDACLNTATKLGLTTWLDATPDGAQVYGPLGFAPTIQLRRLRLANAPGSGGAPLPAATLTEFLTCDIGAMGFDRRGLLQELSGRAGSRLISNGDAVALVRDGRSARHIGPLFAESSAHALAMVRNVAAAESGPLLIDAIAAQTVFLDGLKADGWTIERPFQRMRFGRATVAGTELPFAVAGPEFG